jgi:hypothetical protein
MLTAEARAQCRVPVLGPPPRHGGMGGWWGQVRLVGAGDVNVSHMPLASCPSLPAPISREVTGPTP